MRIFVRVRPGAQAEKAEKIGEREFLVAVKEPPVEGRANRAVIGALANYFGVGAARVRIISGLASRRKIVEIL